MLDKATLKSSLYNAMYSRLTATGATPTSTQISELLSLSSDMGEAIDSFVKGAHVNYTTGLVAPNGAVTGTITHTIT